MFLRLSIFLVIYFNESFKSISEKLVGIFRCHFRKIIWWKSPSNLEIFCKIFEKFWVNLVKMLKKNCNIFSEITFT